MVSKNQFVKDLRVGDNVDSLFAIKYKKPPREYDTPLRGLVPATF